MWLHEGSLYCGLATPRHLEVFAHQCPPWWYFTYAKTCNLPIFIYFFYTYICSKFKGFNILLWCRETKKWTNSNYPNSFRHYLYIDPSRNVNRINQILGMKKWFNVRGKTLLSINEIVHLNAFMLSGRDELQLIFDILNVIYGRKSVSIKRKKKNLNMK